MAGKLTILFRPEAIVPVLSIKILSSFITEKGVHSTLTPKFKLAKEGLELTEDKFVFHALQVAKANWTMTLWVQDDANITFDPSESTDFTWTLDQNVPV